MMKQSGQQHLAERAVAETAAKDELFVQTINHYRHDWMNDLQVLYGYLKLKKYDKMRDYVETIKQKMVRESCISKLGVPFLVVYLHSFRVRCRSILLEVGLEQEFNLTELPIPAEAVAELIIESIETFARHVKTPAGGEPNRLTLELSAEEGWLRLSFDYCGCYDLPGLRSAHEDVPRLYRGGQPIASGGVYDDRWAALTIRVPLDDKDGVTHVSG